MVTSTALFKVKTHASVLLRHVELSLLLHAFVARQTNVIFVVILSLSVLLSCPPFLVDGKMIAITEQNLGTLS